MNTNIKINNKNTSRDAILTLIAAAALMAFVIWGQDNLNGYVVQVLSLVAINGILAVSLNLIYGFTGMFSLGHAGFMAVGAYTCALLILPAHQKEMIYILEPLIWPFSVMQAPFAVAVIAGGLMSAAVSLVIAIPVLRLGGDYLGIATLGFAEIIRVVFTNATPITNGALGIKGIPNYANLSWCWGWFIFTLYIIIKLLNSNTGTCLKAIRDDEVASKAMGLDVFKYRVLAFSVGAFFAGIGGALMASLITTIDPRMFTFLLTFSILMITVAGGLGSITGSVLGSLIITVMLEWLRFVEDAIDIGPIHIPGIPGMRMVIFSVALLLIILFRREGIMGKREWTWSGLFNIFNKLKNFNFKAKRGDAN